MGKYILLDRDGIINVEKDYLYKTEDLEFEEKVIEGLTILRDLSYKFIVVTNQSGIARGYYSEEDLHKFNNYLNARLAEQGLHIEKFFYCPHHPEQGLGIYKKDCDCRKPKAGMLLAAISEFSIEKDSAYMLGDKISDIKAALEAGIEAILIKTGYGANFEEEAKQLSVKTFDNIYDFAIYLKTRVEKY